MKEFTSRQEEQIREVLDSLMQCGTAHIGLTSVTKKYYDKDNEIQWYTVTANMPYTLQNISTGETYTDDKTYEISVGVLKDRRRHVYTALDRSQHDTRRVKKTTDDNVTSEGEQVPVTSETGDKGNKKS